LQAPAGLDCKRPRHPRPDVPAWGSSFKGGYQTRKNTQKRQGRIVLFVLCVSLPFLKNMRYLVRFCVFLGGKVAYAAASPCPNDPQAGTSGRGRQRRKVKPRCGSQVIHRELPVRMLYGGICYSVPTPKKIQLQSERAFQCGQICQYVSPDTLPAVRFR
jgi:hypothetical protein